MVGVVEQPSYSRLSMKLLMSPRRQLLSQLYLTTFPIIPWLFPPSNSQGQKGRYPIPTLCLCSSTHHQSLCCRVIVLTSALRTCIHIGPSHHLISIYLNLVSQLLTVFVLNSSSPCLSPQSTAMPNHILIPYCQYMNQRTMSHMATRMTLSRGLMGSI